MAIRSGSGSLKYPLLNQAQIVAQQSAAAASAGGSASASAYGANRAFAANKMRVQADLANSAAERQFRAASQMEAQGFQNYQQEQNRDFNAIQNQNQINAYADRQQAGFDNAKELQQGYQTFTAGQEQKSQDFQSGRDQTQFDQNTAAMEAHIQAGKMQLNPAAQDKLNKLEADRATIESDGTFTNAQVNEFMQQYRIKKAGIISTATPTATPADQANQSGVLFDPKTGGYSMPVPGQPIPEGMVHGQYGEKGFQPTIDTSKQDAAKQKEQEKADKAAADAQQKRKEAISSRADQLQKDVAKKDDGTTLSREDALKQAEETLKTDEAFHAQQSGQQPAAVEGGPVPNFVPGQTPVQGGPIPNFSPGTTPVQGGPIPLAPAPQTFNMQSNGARIESANRADIYGAPPPQPMPPNDSAQPVRPQPVAGNYSIPGAPGGGELQGNGARMGQQNVVNSPQAVQQRAELQGGPAAGSAQPPPEVKSTVADIRSQMKDLPLDTSKETPAMRDFFNKNLENITQYHDTPLDQVPEAARPAVDFYGRMLRSVINKQPVVLKTPEEMAMLPPDTPFVDSEGKPRRTNKKGA